MTAKESSDVFAWEPERRAGLAGGTTRPSEEGTLNSFVKAEHVLDGRYSFRSIMPSGYGCPPGSGVPFKWIEHRLPQHLLAWACYQKKATKLLVA